MHFYNPSPSAFVAKDHPYRRLIKLIHFGRLTRDLKECYSDLGRSGYPVEQGFKCLVLQFMEDLSDRELQKYLEESITAKFFCGFEMADKTPDHSYFGRLRSRIGIERLMDLFTTIQFQLKQQGLMREIFTFVDASQMISKLATWEERDKAIGQGLEKYNNAVAASEKVEVRDREARYGCKSKKKYWYGYKRHVSVDMKHGLINKVHVTPANVPDHDGLKDVCPDGGMVLADKAYCPQKSRAFLQEQHCHSGVILKNNMKGKNQDKDRWLTKLRMPYESVFSKMQKKCRYIGLAKNQFQGIMQAMAYNFKRLITIDASPLIT